MNESAIVLRSFGIEKAGLNYSEKANAYLTPGYTSTANNTYFCALRLGEGIMIKEDIGQGYRHTFLNGIKVYSVNDRVLLAERSFHCEIYNKRDCERYAHIMLLDLLETALRKENIQLDKRATSKKVQQVVSSIFSIDQRMLA